MDISAGQVHDIFYLWKYVMIKFIYGLSLYLFNVWTNTYATMSIDKIMLQDVAWVLHWQSQIYLGKTKLEKHELV